MISILMPVRNEASYLKPCLESILHQTEIDWELIAVDDSSTDDSFDILSEYMARDKRICVVRSNGKGIIDALRLAFDLSNGRFITRMDADDLMLPAKLGGLKSALLRSGPQHVVTGLVEYFSASSLGNGYISYTNWLNDLTSRHANFDDLYKECPIPSPCWMLYRDDLTAIGGFDPNDYPEDYDLCFRMAQAKFKVTGVDQILHRWRDYPERTSRNDSNYADHTFMDIKIKYFLKLHYDNHRQLIIWGLGSKGKSAAKLFIKNGIDFRWICNNPNKIGLSIYDTLIESFEIIEQTKNMQIIVLVASPKDQHKIQAQLDAKSLIKNKDYYFFC